ncbi:MAG TPA: thioredoxin domain-containing protein [Bryobacteraceae bacterium]|nr:thioredoxin domain-containing protein [Bryobacteraceae bacterium]
MTSFSRTFLPGLSLWVALAVGAATGQSPVAERCTIARDGDAESGADGTVAIVVGQPILARDLENMAGPQILQLRNQEYQIKSRVLEDLIRQRVVEAEASKQGLTVEQFYVKEIDARIPMPSEAEVFAYYSGLKSQINKPFQEVKTQLEGNLKTLETKQLREEYANYLRGKADVTMLLQPIRVKVGFAFERLRGDANAPVTIVEFADYQCPYCQQAEATMKELLKKYPGKVNLAFRDFPLSSIHPYAQKASEAARCAGKQGKFWEFHDALFADQANLDERGLKAVAQTLALDESGFASCLASGEFATQVSLDQDDGRKAGIASTPGFFVNGVPLSGAQPIAEFEKLIDNELKLANHETAARPAQ